MPKLKDHAVEANQVKIEQAALRIFTRQGYHGTSVREIADEAGISLGNIYNYYKTKEQIFESLVKRYDQQITRQQVRSLIPLLGSLEPENLQRLAAAVREIVYENPDYWRLMYIDVVEFGNRHFAHIFRDISANLKRLSPDSFVNGGAANGVDPSLAFTSVYLQFFTYFLIEKLFGGKQHLGVPDDEAVSQLIRIFTTGIGGNGHTAQPCSKGPARKAAAAAQSSRRKKQ